MSLTEGGYKPIITAVKPTLENFILVGLRSKLKDLDFHKGKVAEDGKTVKTKHGDIHPDNVFAEPGEKVITFQ